jgi:predicted Fe-Mo cluster-binding NifX family protein
MAMRIAVPTRAGAFCEHFGRSDGVFLCEARPGETQARECRILPRPKAACEAVPPWLVSLGVTHVLAGGIGQVALHHLAELGITVSAGHHGQDPAAVVAAYLAGTREPQPNPCADLEHRHQHCRAKQQQRDSRRHAPAVQK